MREHNILNRRIYVGQQQIQSSIMGGTYSSAEPTGDLSVNLVQKDYKEIFSWKPNR
jgi:hypothetical protein